MKTILIGGAVLFALYVISQNQTAPMSTASTSAVIPPTTVSSAIANASISSVKDPGFDLAFDGTAGMLSGPPLGNDFLLNPVIAVRNNLRIAPAWLAAQAQ